MCGIAGIVMREDGLSERQLKRMQNLLLHRGPDGTGQIVKGNVGLAHTRLAIIDLDTGNQPIKNSTNDFLIANAEVYNYLEIKEEIGNHKFTTKSDCESPLVLFQNHGASFVTELRGMYSIAILENNDAVHLYRDPFGIKPLYIMESKDGVAFSSEIRAVTETGFIKPALNFDAVYQLLDYQFTCGKDTVIKGVQRVLPGEYIKVKNGEIKSERNINNFSSSGVVDVSEEEALLKLDDVLMDSVEIHQRSDVPYGMFLSGGIDSSVILACMRELNDEPVCAFTVGFDVEKTTDERIHAKYLAEISGAEFCPIEFSEKDFWDLLPQVAACLDDPITDYATLPTFKLAQAANKSGLKVVLSGEGGDELFAGYGRYRKQLRPWWFGGAVSLRKGIFSGTNILNQPTIPFKSIENLDKNLTKVQTSQMTDIQDWLPNDLLVKLDRCLMAHGVEGRTPFLDEKVADFAMQLPDKLKINRGLGKYILRKWLKKKMPEAQPFSKKRGFTVPVGHWMSKKASLVGSLVSSQECIKEVANSSEVVQLFSKLETTSSKKVGRMAWSLLFYSLWHLSHIQGKSLEGDIFEILAD